ncbi:MAG TPA: hypothetical protein DDZ80_15570 [Cyanobacteria bacterium UBA8803]|nr:hypothetical protein [Cyanobacteria bacterium UBA9273]HBL59835.1 hypothetical protein [Cyanobacteria bacterium UBA8803]
MKELYFALQPFDAAPLPDLKINGTIARNVNTVTLSYELLGDLTKIMIPAIANLPTRKHGLWAETCFEFFLGIKDSPRYWEFNLSPAGHWNVYRFDDYRQGMQEEIALTSLPFRVQELSKALRLNLELDLGNLIPENRAIVVAITTVIKLKNGDISYWALTHCGAQADFHRRDSFIYNL